MTDARPAPGSARPYRFPTTEQARLPNGLTVLTAPLRRLPAATLLLLTPAGGEREAAGTAGLASLAALGLTEGTESRDANVLAMAFEQLWGELFSDVEWTHAECGTTVMSRRTDATLALMGEAIRTPTFPSREVERLRQERLAELLQQRSEPRGLADDLLVASCFPAGHRLSLPLGGDPTSVRACTVELVRAFHAAHTGPLGSALIVAGDVDAETVLRRAEEVFGDWKGASGAAVRAPMAPKGPRRVRLVHRPAAAQSEVRIGHASVPRTHPDVHAIAVMNAILGGLFNSRINLNLRERHAYTYGAFSSFDWRHAGSIFSVSTAVQSDVTAQAVSEILMEVDRIRSEPVTDDELTLARDYLTGVFPLRFETTAAIAHALAARIGHGLDETYYDTYRDRVRAVDALTVQRVAREQLHPDRLQVVVVGDAVVAGPALAALSLGDVERVEPPA